MTEVPFLDLAAAHAELDGQLEKAMLRVLRSGRYLHGAEVQAFEAEFAQYCGASAAVGVGNGLQALQLTIEALGIGQGDEVLVSAHTPMPTWLAITHAGAKPVPIEPDPGTMVIDTTRVDDAISARTAAIVAVHLYGMPADMDALTRIARKHRLALIEDASQAHGARFRGRPVGSLADAAAFSLYPTKNLGAAGDAGIAVSNDGSLVDRIRMLANYGQRRRHHSEVPGHNSRLDELQAAVLRVKLHHLDEWNERRRARAEQYRGALGGCAEIQLPIATSGAMPVWHQFVIQMGDRDLVRDELGRRGVETLIHYPIPPHRSRAYASDYQRPLPITERLAASVLSLPISPQLTKEACAFVSDTLIASVAATHPAHHDRGRLDSSVAMGVPTEPGTTSDADGAPSRRARSG